MAKKGKQKQHHEQEDPGRPPAKMKRKQYEQEMAHAHPGATRTPTRWVGWVVFASFTMITLGAIEVMMAMVAFFNKAYYSVASSALGVPKLTYWSIAQSRRWSWPPTRRATVPDSKTTPTTSSGH